jgi:ATP-dependent Lon protease
LEEAQKNGDFIGIVSQKNSDLEQPAEKIYTRPEL